MQDGRRAAGLRAYLNARALAVTATRGLLLGAVLVAFALVDAGARRQPAGELALMAVVGIAAVSLALGPIALAELRSAADPSVGRWPLVAGWALSMVSVVVATTQVVYATSVLETRSFDGGLHGVVEFWRLLLGSADDLLGFVMLVVMIPGALAMVSAIRLGRLSYGVRTTFTVLTFPGGLIALAIYGGVDALFRRLAPARRAK